ncbi:MAG: hypothetical protein KGR42_00400 [Acidobacteria bacterium]|nr:hypothetical protein [Acidobacteriota bacterium]
MVTEYEWLDEVNQRLLGLRWPVDPESSLTVGVELVADGEVLTLHLGPGRVSVERGSPSDPRFAIRLDASRSDLADGRLDLLRALGAGRLTLHGGAGALISLSPVLADVLSYPAEGPSDE